MRTYPIAFGLRVQRLLKTFVKHRSEPTKLPNEPPEGWNVPLMFQRMSFKSTNWSEARLRECCIYLRGSKGLNVPQRWKNVFPTDLEGI